MKSKLDLDEIREVSFLELYSGVPLVEMVYIVLLFSFNRFVGLTTVFTWTYWTAVGIAFE